MGKIHKESLTNKYNWEGKNFPTKMKNCKKFQKNNPTTPSNNLIAQSNKEEIKQA